MDVDGEHGRYEMETDASSTGGRQTSGRSHERDKNGRLSRRVSAEQKSENGRKKNEEAGGRQGTG